MPDDNANTSDKPAQDQSCFCMHKGYRNTSDRVTCFCNIGVKSPSGPEMTWLAVLGPSNDSKRSWSSRAALLLNVMTTSCHGLQPCCRMRCSTRAVSTRVLPLPGPATILQSSWEDWVNDAARWGESSSWSPCCLLLRCGKVTGLLNRRSVQNPDIQQVIE